VVGIMSCASSTKWQLLGILDNRKIRDGFIGVLLPWNGTYSRDAVLASRYNKIDERQVNFR
jgi:hypothetical protein